MKLKLNLAVTYTNLTGFIVTLLGIFFNQEAVALGGIGLIGAKKAHDMVCKRRGGADEQREEQSIGTIP